MGLQYLIRWAVQNLFPQARALPKVQTTAIDSIATVITAVVLILLLLLVCPFSKFQH